MSEKNKFLWILIILIYLVNFNLAKGQMGNDAGESVGSVIDTPSIAYKNLKKSNIDFENIDLNKFLSLKLWINNVDEKAKYPEWEKNLKERAHKEIVGHFFQCVGNCRVDRAESFFNAKFRTNLYEGDEVSTIGESYAWIFLIDGTIVRLAPYSSITFNEFNIGVEENFIFARVNFGNINWQSRKEIQFNENNFRETDQLFFPLNFYDAQPEKEVKVLEESNVLNFLESPKTNINQYRRLNNLIEENKSLTKNKPTFALIVVPNISFFGYSPSIEIISILGGKSYFKLKSNTDLNYKEGEDSPVEYQRRGFENKELVSAQYGDWYEVDEKGRNVIVDQNPSLRVAGEFVTKRIPSILVARELLLREYGAVAFQQEYDKNKLALNYGYRLWGKLKSGNSTAEDLGQRLEFLKEYSRRTETTNLMLSEKFSKRLLERGEKLNSLEYGPYFFSKSLDKYFSTSDDNEEEDKLNSTTKKLWKIMHGIR